MNAGCFSGRYADRYTGLSLPGAGSTWMGGGRGSGRGGVPGGPMGWGRENFERKGIQ